MKHWQDGKSRLFRFKKFILGWKCANTFEIEYWCIFPSSVFCLIENLPIQKPSAEKKSSALKSIHWYKRFFINIVWWNWDFSPSYKARKKVLNAVKHFPENENENENDESLKNICNSATGIHVPIISKRTRNSSLEQYFITFDWYQTWAEAYYLQLFVKWMLKMTSIFIICVGIVLPPQVSFTKTFNI